MHTAAEGTTAALAAVLLILLALIAVRAWRRSRITPEEKERRRRAMLLATGKLGDANLIEIQGDVLVYSYAVRGVEYTAAQDVSALRPHLPADLALLGSIGVRYDPRNPANSMVLAEGWSGLD